mmetsp:Transcript_8361/g.12386  ORF Transcript_8361/g.12386 Transcript_8361/m.12386 type:complete len:80 (+) Transcript_8361:522-761(+)
MFKATSLRVYTQACQSINMSFCEPYAVSRGIKNSYSEPSLLPLPDVSLEKQQLLQLPIISHYLQKPTAAVQGRILTTTH